VACGVSVGWPKLWLLIHGEVSQLFAWREWAVRLLAMGGKEEARTKIAGPR